MKKFKLPYPAVAFVSMDGKVRNFDFVTSRSSGIMRPFHTTPIVDPLFLWHSIPASDLMSIGAIPFSTAKLGSTADAAFSEFMLCGDEGRYVDIIDMFDHVTAPITELVV